MMIPVSRYDAARAAWRNLDAARVPAVDVLLVEPRVTAFAEQFAVDVTRFGPGVRCGFFGATGADAFAVVQAIWVEDMRSRLGPALRAVADLDWPLTPVPTEVADRWPLLEELMRAIAQLDALDPTLTELVRLRGARQHNCRLCRSRRSAAALDHGADEATFDAVDEYVSSDLPERAKAALALVDAMIWTPQAIPADVVTGVCRHLSRDEAVEVVLDVVRNATNKIAVALGADAPEVTEGVQLFVTDADGVLSTV
jgi:alkylhydroperoxidase family enzyme